MLHKLRLDMVYISAALVLMLLGVIQLLPDSW
jgi:hypothetical protein